MIHYPGTTYQNPCTALAVWVLKRFSVWVLKKMRKAWEVIDLVWVCLHFPTTLKEPARVWFSKIPLNTVRSFEELSKLFVNNFIGGQRHKHFSSSLLTIKQGENKSLQSFITRFNKEALTMDEMDDKLLLVAFHNGVNSNLFIHKLYEQEPQTMAEFVHSAQNFMNA